MSELCDKQVNAQKEKNFWGSRKLPQAHEKVGDENETKKQRRKKGRTCKNVIDGRKPFILYRAHMKNRRKRFTVLLNYNFIFTRVNMRCTTINL